MICLLRCVEITRPLAAVAKNVIGLNSAPFGVLGVVRRFMDFDLGARDITASLPFRRELNCLSVTNAWHRPAPGDSVAYASGHTGVDKYYMGWRTPIEAALSVNRVEFGLFPGGRLPGRRYII